MTLSVDDSAPLDPPATDARPGRAAAALALLSPRARYGLIFLAALLCLEALGRLNEGIDAKRAERRFAEQQAARIESVEDLQLWTARAQEARDAASAWSAFFWTGDTPGIIAANLQRSLSEGAKAQRVDLTRIEVDPAPVSLSAARSGLRFSATGSAASSDDFARYLGAMSDLRPAVFTDELSLRFMPSGNLSFTFGGVAPIASAPAPAVSETLIEGAATQ